MDSAPVRYSLIALLGIASVVLFTALFVGYREAGRTETLTAVRSSFATISSMAADAATNGYFQWTELQDAVVQGRSGWLEGWLQTLPTQVKFARRAWIEEGPPPPGLREQRPGPGLVMVYSLNDSEGNHPLADHRAVVDFDAAAILALAAGAQPLVLDPQGLPLGGGLGVRWTEASLRWYDALAIVGFSAVACLAAAWVFRREDRFFYEAKGLDTIIYLFEQNERYSAHHSRNVASITEDLGRRLGYRGRRLQDLKTAALLHDIGKIAVPQAILKKPGRLTEDERTQVEAHAETSAQILEHFAELSHLAPWVRSHHEKLDGSGYPQGLQGDEIPLEAKIIAVADIYEALTGARPYRVPHEKAEALALLRTMAVDQSIVDALEALVL